MQIAILGGTGAIGEGLALRWARDTDHDVFVGSRDAERARESAVAYANMLKERGVEESINGFENVVAAEKADVILLSVPPYYIADTIESITDTISDAVLVSPAVGFDRDADGFHYDPPPAGSVTAHAAKAAPDCVPVVGTFHNLPAARLADLDADLGLDTPVVADDRAAKRTVLDLVNEIAGLRGVDVGPIANAPEAEGLVPLLLNITENTGLDDVGVAFT